MKTDDAPVVVDDAAAKTSQTGDEPEFDEDLIAALALLGLPGLAKNNE